MRADLVVVGGGGIFFVNEIGISFSRILTKWKYRLQIARCFGARIMFFAISLEIRDQKNLEALKSVFHHHDFILCRDALSSAKLASIGILSETISDAVFLDTSEKVKKQNNDR